jgi:pSer/pThr/pTyr-binding forkhead associated (FHA) protein
LVRGEAFELHVGKVCVLGRGESCDVVVPDVLVSRRHLEIRVLPTGVVLEDLQSRNGVYVNGARLARPTLVQAGDHLLLGTTEVSIFSSPNPGSEPGGVPLFRIRKRGAM